MALGPEQTGHGAVRPILAGCFQNHPQNNRSGKIYFQKNFKNPKIFLCILEKMGYNSKE